MKLPYTVSVIPLLYFRIIHATLSARLMYFLFREPKIFSQIFRGNHGIFIKNIDRGVLTVFPDRQDSGHIDQFRILCVFKKRPQEIQIPFLRVFTVLGNPEYTLPFI